MRSALARRVSRHAPLVLASALALSCKPKGPVEPDAATKEAAAVAAVAAAPVTATARAAQILPAGTTVLVTAASPNRVAEVFERERLVQTFAAEYALARGATTEILGFDALDPSAYADVGIDPEGPIGFALLDVTSGVFAVFATIKDAGKIKATARSAAGRRQVELQERDYGGAVVLRHPQDKALPAIVLRGEVAMVVIPMREEPPVDFAERIATIPPEESLSRARGYRRAMGGYDGGDALAFFDPAAIASQLTMARTDVEPPTQMEDWAAKELAAAKEKGAPAEEIARLEAQAAENKKMADSWARRDEAAREALALTVSGVEGIGVRLSAKTSGVFIEAQGAVGQDAFAKKALKNVPGRALLANAMSGEPMFMLSGGLDPAVVQPWLDLVFQANGRSWSDVAAEVKKQADIDLDAELLPQLDGEAGFAVSLDQPMDFAKPDALKRSIGFAGHAKIKDPQAVKALLEKADASSGELGSRMKADGDRYVIDVPDYRKVWVELAGQQLLVTTDGQLGVRVTRNMRGMMGRVTDPPQAWAAMMMPDRSVVYAQDHRFFMLMFAGFSVSEMGVSEPAHLAGVPLSRKAKAKKKEIEGVDKKIDAARAKQEMRTLEMLDGIVAPFGTLVLTAAHDDRGIAVLGGQFTRNATLGALLESAIKAVIRSGPMSEDDDGGLGKLFEERSRLENELMQIREADAARLGGRKPRGGAKGPAAPVPASTAAPKKKAAEPKPKAAAPK